VTTERPSQPPASLVAPATEWTALRSGALKAYRDDALLERVRTRLGRERRPARSALVWQAAAALVVFAVGVGVGRGLPSDDLPIPAQGAGPRVTPENRSATATLRQVTPERREANVRPKAERHERRRAAPLPIPTGSPTVPSDTVPAEMSIPSPVEAAPSATTPRPSWLELAERGDFAGALADLEKSRGAEVVLATGSVEELMTLAEVARFAGNQERAIQALSQVVDRYGRDPNAPLAAMMLGNLLSRSGDATGAARAFALNRTLSPGGDFAEDALVREFDLALAAENAALAASLFEQYAREFPTGPHVFAMRYELDELLDTLESERPEAGKSESGKSESGRPDVGKSDVGHVGQEALPGGSTPRSDGSPSDAPPPPSGGEE